MGERSVRIAEVGGSNPPISTKGDNRQNSYLLFLLSIWWHRQVVIDDSFFSTNHNLLDKRAQFHVSLENKRWGNRWSESLTLERDFPLGLTDSYKLLFPFSLHEGESDFLTVMVIVLLIYILYKGFQIFKWFITHGTSFPHFS